MIRWYPIDPDFTVVAAPPFAVAAADEGAVAAIWEAQKRRRGDALFDGSLWLVVAHDRKRLVLAPARYRYAMARRFDNPLGRRLGISPAGVTGLLLCRDGLVLGRRAAHVTVPNRWEAAPAGSLDSPDPATLLVNEIGEELGIPPARLGPPGALGLVEDTGSGVMDLVFRVACDLAGAEVEAAWRASGCREYRELAVVAPTHLPAFLQANRYRLVSVLRPMLKAAGLILD